MSINRQEFQSTPRQRRLALCVAPLFVCCSVACGDPETQSRRARAAIGIGPEAPADLQGGAFNASLRQAANFAWTQFIALNWPAVPQNGAPGTRGTPHRAGLPPQEAAIIPRVWATLRAKTELFPGSGEPDATRSTSPEHHGYDMPPLYRYDPTMVGYYPGLESGLVPACFAEQSNNEPPWIELSESHEVGPEQMYAGMAPGEAIQGSNAGQRVMYAVKVDRKYYGYVAGKGWLGGGNPDSTIPARATREYVTKEFRSPPAGSAELVSFPNESIQIKTAWRRLTRHEKSSGRFHTTIARSYQAQDPSQQYYGQTGNPKLPCYIDAEWGLIGMHIKTKTPTAPYYIWSTFEQVDNITSRAGLPVEDDDGRLILNADRPSTDPIITSRNAVAAVPATPATIQKMSPANAAAHPAKRLYYKNNTGTPTTQGTIALNRRQHAIAEPVIESNRAAHQAIRQYLDNHKPNAGFFEASLMHYKLISVQWKPADKPVPGKDLRADPSEPNEVLRYPLIYYMANIALETSYRLQNYSGVVQPPLSPPFETVDVQDLISDFDRNSLPVKNVMYDARMPDGRIPGYNMGGCMGCHGQMQLAGYDFSFILRRGRVDAPEVGDSIRMSLADMVHARTSNE